MVLPSCTIFGVAGTISTDFQSHQTRSYSCLFLANTRFRLVYIEWSNIPSLVVDYFLWYLEVIQLKLIISQCIFLLWDSGNLRQCNVALRNLLSLLPAVFIFCKATVMEKGLRKQWKNLLKESNNQSLSLLPYRTTCLVGVASLQWNV